MLFLILTTCFGALSVSAKIHRRRAPEITNHVFPLVAASHPHLLTPSSTYLHQRRTNSSLWSGFDGSGKRDNVTPSMHTRSGIPADLQTLGGRIYTVNATLAGKEYTFVLDTGSSDTWIATSNFQCLSSSGAPVAQKQCGFGTLYDITHSPTFVDMPDYDFGVQYTDGEFLDGDLGTEQLGIGGPNDNQLQVTQTIGVVRRGYWLGDRFSSGLMGFAYPALASNAGELNYNTVVWSLFANGQLPPVFSIALSRPTIATPAPGGLLAIGGIPDIAHDSNWVIVNISPIFYNTYAFYSIPVDGFIIVPPLNTPSSSRPPTMNYVNSPLQMIVDSGSSLNRFPDAIADYIASLFYPKAVYSAATGSYQVPCSASAPNVGVVIGGRAFWMNVIDLMNTNPGAVKATGGTCTVGILRQGGGDAILGDTWMKNVLAVFDVQGNQMAFAGRMNY